MDPSVNFFLMPTRIWEFLMGTTAFLFQKEFKQKLINFNKHIMDIIFIILLLFLLFYKIDLYHPSIITFLPLFITSVLIINESNDNFVNKILSSRLFVFIGNISYSLYLWHFPIIVALRYYNLENSILYLTFSLILIFLLTTISFYLVENKLRKASDLNFFIFLISLIILIISTIFVFSKKIQTNEFFINDKSYNIKLEKEKRWNLYKKFCVGNECKLNDKINDNFKTILFVGDSLIPDAINLMRFNDKDNFRFIENSSGGCPPIKNSENIPNFIPDRNNCIKCNF